MVGLAVFGHALQHISQMRPDQQHIDGVDIFIQLGIAACDKFKVRFLSSRRMFLAMKPLDAPAPQTIRIFFMLSPPLFTILLNDSLFTQDRLKRVRRSLLIRAITCDFNLCAELYTQLHDLDNGL